MVVCVFVMSGCAMTVVAPAGVREPVEVYLIDYGRHSSIVMEREEGEWAEYAWGDWSYFGKSRRDPLTTAMAILVPTRGALGWTFV